LIAYPTADESRDRLRRAGWTAGEIATVTRWEVYGSNGENRIEATSKARATAWWLACVPARAVGIRMPVRGMRG
jgi:hypothetical protein